ncbi:complement C2-like [Lytechinus variegatus]|uniref:complement C2-like n=1 Tax=Lytechinus variegatus TaxID=7654 RepID=UPI001BB162C5|nr:complement C2-like [Lytechinus variegatus]
MTIVFSCAYGIAHLRCTYDSVSNTYQLFVRYHKTGAINCSAPYIPHDASVEHLRLNYAFGDRINVTCDASDAYFTLQCHNKGLWSGPVVSCPSPAAVTAPRHAYCSAPAVPPHSTNQNPRLSYKEGDNINVTCNEGSGWYPLECSDGIWIGQNIVCPNPTIDCNQPIIPAVSSLDTYRSHYKVDEVVNITCNTSPDSILWECHKDGQWRGPEIRCPVSQPLSSADTAGRVGEKPVEKWHGRDLITTGLLVAAVIMFVLVLMSMVAFSISFKGWHSGSAKDDKNADRGPLPDVPGGYADYLVGEKSLYTEPYLKPSSIPQGYETYEKPM